MRLLAKADVPYGTASELAAARLIALLPAQWACPRLECTPTTPTLTLAPPRPAPPREASWAEVIRVVDEALAQSTLRGWARAPS
ncbi:hypothetical protein ACFZCY_27970 [Streptomyces sp. NPDC007983]|uniref:hypothetical protein n=1 Tax=Streptomyces sp. NPDC007983 TaxID=3364800 RepID=UPI0036E21D1B